MTRKKEIIFIIITLLLTLTLAEGFFRFFIERRNRLGNLEKRNTFEPYQNKPWVDQYFRDGKECSKQRAEAREETGTYVRYILHDLSHDCTTKSVNIALGMRKTWNPNPDSLVGDAKIYTLAMFGGSTMQGVGLPDDLTIPSHFSKLVNEAAKDNTVYIVKNYGVSSYTFTQSLIKLILLLREGERFDYVIFYGGTNDIDNAYDVGEAGALIGEKALKNRLEGGTSGQIREFFKRQLNSCGICRTIVIISRNTPILRDYVTPYLVRARDVIHFKEGKRKDDQEIVALAKDIAEYYAKSHELLDALSRAYDFKYAEFWQPALLYGEEQPVGGEKIILNIDPRLTDDKLKELYRLSRDKINSMRLENFHDISGALLLREKAYYLDAAHISDEGNKAVAEDIYAILKNELSI